MFRFSLGALFLLVSFSAVGCAALIYANDIWRQVMVTVAVLSLSLATVMAFVSRQNGRSFAIGFAILGWIYLILVFTPMADVSNHLLTTRALDWLSTNIHGPVGRINANLYTDFDNDGWQDLVLSNSGSVSNSLAMLRYIGTPQPAIPGNFLVIGQSLWTLLLAWFGGLVAECLTRQGKNAPKPG